MIPFFSTIGFHFSNFFNFFNFQTDMDIQDLYNRLCGSNDGRLLRPTAFIAQVEAFPAFAELPLPDSPDEREQYFRLLADYGISLYAVGRYGGAAGVLTRVITLLEADKEKDGLWRTGVYEQSLLYRCHVLSAQGHQEAARRDAFVLLAHCPDELQYRRLVHGFEAGFRAQGYRKASHWLLVVLFAGLLITVARPADPSVRFLGHLLGGAGAVGGLVNYVVWKYWYASWKKRQEK